MARVTEALARTALAAGLSIALALGGTPASALAEMAEEAMGAEQAARGTSAQTSATTGEQPMGEEGAQPDRQTSQQPVTASEVPDMQDGSMAEEPIATQGEPADGNAPIDGGEAPALETQGVIASGTYSGGQCTWSLDSNGTFTISAVPGTNGEVGVEICGPNERTLYEHQSEVKRVVVSEGVKALHESAFPFGNITSIELPSSLWSLGTELKYEFSTVPAGGGFMLTGTSVTSITIPASVTRVMTGEYVDAEKYPTGYPFSGASSLKHVAFQEGMSTIPENICNGSIFLKGNQSTGYRDVPLSEFAQGYSQYEHWLANPLSLETVTIPATVTKIGANAFHECGRIKVINFGGTEAQWRQVSIAAGNEGLEGAVVCFAKGDASSPTVMGGVDWSAVYDPAWYAEKNPDVANWAKGNGGALDGAKLLRHFVSSGRGEGRASKQGFELASYFNANPDLRRAFGIDWARYYDHYRSSGQREGRACSGVGQLQGPTASRDGVDWSPVYDGAYYAQRNPDVAGWATRRFASGSVVDDAALLQHFANSGTKECRSGKQGFDVRSYYNANPDLRAAFGGSADWTKYYRHYATNGSREGRKCAGADQLQGTVTKLNGTDWSPVYDRAYYGQQSPDVVSWATRKCGSATVLDDYAMLSHFVNNGRKEGRASKAGFELASYYNANADLRRAFGTDWARYYDHYRANGQREGRAATGVGQLRGAATSAEGVDWAPVYDALYYAQKNSDVANWATRRFSSGSVLDDAALLSHFVSSGQGERRQAKATFNVNSYRNRYADLRSAFGTDWPRYYRHFCTNGFREGRIGA